MNLCCQVLNKPIWNFLFLQGFEYSSQHVYRLVCSEFPLISRTFIFSRVIKIPPLAIKDSQDPHVASHQTKLPGA